MPDDGLFTILHGSLWDLWPWTRGAWAVQHEPSEENGRAASAVVEDYRFAFPYYMGPGFIPGLELHAILSHGVPSTLGITRTSNE